MLKSSVSICAALILAAAAFSAPAQARGGAHFGGSRVGTFSGVAGRRETGVARLSYRGGYGGGYGGRYYGGGYGYYGGGLAAGAVLAAC